MVKRSSLLKRMRWYLDLTFGRNESRSLPPSRQLVEILLLLAFRGIGPGYYHTAGFWRREVPFREKWGHLNGREYQRCIRRANPTPYHKLSQNKIAEKGILTLLGFPTPRCLGVLDTEDGRAWNGSSLRNAEDLRRLLLESGVARVCFKPVEGWAGVGFRAAEVRGRGTDLRCRSLDGQTEVSVEEFHRSLLRERNDRYLLEEYIEQHPDLSSFNPSSVNTLRLWVVKYPDQKTKVVVGYLRIGRSGSLVDNQSAGGIVAPVDLQTGILQRAIDGNPEREEFIVHPDHGAAIEGKKVPFLEEAKTLASSALGPFSEIRFAGLDVAITTTGPVLLELNVNPDRKGAAFADVVTGVVLNPFQ